MPDCIRNAHLAPFANRLCVWVTVMDERTGRTLLLLEGENQ